MVGGAANASAAFAGPAPVPTSVTAATSGDYEVAAYCGSNQPSGWDPRLTYPTCAECKFAALSYELGGNFEAYCLALQTGRFQLWTRCIACRAGDVPQDQDDALEGRRRAGLRT